MSRPPEAMSDTHARVMTSVLVDALPTYGTIKWRTGFSRQTIHRVLHDLRELRLVDFEEGKQGTIRSLVGVAAHDGA